MADDRDTLRDIRNLLRRREARATRKPHDEINEQIRESIRRAKAESAGLAAADDPKRPTKAELLALRAELLAADKDADVGVRTLAKLTHTSSSTVQRRLTAPDIGTLAQLVEHPPERRRSS